MNSLGGVGIRSLADGEGHENTYCILIVKKTEF